MPDQMKTEGEMTPDEHISFMLRVLLFCVVSQPNKEFFVENQHLLDSTTGQQLQIEIADGVYRLYAVPEQKQ